MRVRSGWFSKSARAKNFFHASGLSQQAVVQDVGAKVLCDNLQALTAMSAHDNADLHESVRINRACVHTALKPLLQARLLGRKVAKLLRVVLRADLSRLAAGQGLR